MRKTLPIIAFVALATVTTSTPSRALDGYSAQEEQQFMDWCTGAKSATESTCSCTLKRVAQTVPAAALTSYLSSLSSGQSMSLTNLATSSATMTAATVAQSLATCGN